MISALVVFSASPGMPDLPADLAAAGVHVLGAAGCDNLVREAIRQAPDVVVCWDAAPGEPLFGALSLLQSSMPMPVVVFTADVQAETMSRALEAGVQAWVVQGYGAARLRPLLQLAQARFQRERQLQDALNDMSQRYEERKVVDRAKGVLMRAGHMPEDEAFRLLRSASMQGKQRVGQVARQVVDAARDAEAVNQAGQLRMLSQRMVKLYALAVSGTEVAAASALLAQSLQRTQQQIDSLRHTLSGPTFGDLLQAVVEAFDALKPLVAAAPAAEALLPADEAAERLLQGADRLTSALQSAGMANELWVVNLCGRQRMLSQRLAKQSLLAALLEGPAARSARDEAGAIPHAFEQAVRQLKEAPLSTEAIRADLAAVEAEWPRLLQGVAAAGSLAGRQQLAQASESLLGLFERLTDRYEHSLQVLIR